MNDEPEKPYWLIVIAIGLPTIAFFVLLQVSTHNGEGITPLQFGFRAIVGGFVSYHEKYGEYPQGSNHEVAAAMLGTDGKGREPVLMLSDRMRNKNGEFLDPWGISYYIKASGDRITIRSAGPDRVMWNKDDVSNEDM